ncbi:hypothetical protein [Hymenobacter ruricola]|uniref:Uncharacterized protein n=1 Tax=Hymenobacter ruricola TaxID=2791023 RepID=A0ABS0HYD9_9BACT|nr:hypothetical protein [Hymenobacter ruricola]MBF9219667.1 hypothetical protein [Hymenobacter ruricola]
MIGVAGWLLTACDGEKVEMQERHYAVGFAQPCPGQAKKKASFPAHWQGVYAASAPGYSLCIGATAVWKQQQRSEMYHASWQQLDSLRLLLSVNDADSSYQDFNGNRHQLHLIGRDSVRDSWLRCDTVFSLAGPHAGQLRRFQGRYYLSTRAENEDYWQVQRLEIAGRHLTWQCLGQDTLRLRALDTAAVHTRRRPGFSLFRVQPASGRQKRHVGDYAGLWETEGAFERRP